MEQELYSGQIPHQLDPQNSPARYVIGADIGGTNLRLALANLTGELQATWSISTVGVNEPQAVVGLIRQGVESLLRESHLPQTSLCAIAVGAPGITNSEQGIVIATSYLMGWRDVPLRDLLEAEFGIPAVVDNDVNMAAIGEHCAGVAQGISDFVFLAVGTGIGAGIMLNGQLLHGKAWTAGEIGYMLVPGVPEAQVERGKPGALESLVGGEGIKALWQRGWSEESSAVSKEASATEIFDAALAGDALAQQVLHLASRTLAYAIYNISLILNCPLFVLGGSVGLHPALGDGVRAVLEQRRARVQPKLISSTLGTQAQLTGAIHLALETAKSGRSAA
jgi:glucokinase